MKYALVNPVWDFEGSIYFGCREPHLPLEFGYAKALLERSGHEALILDGQLDGLSYKRIREQLQFYRPDFTVITTAPSYLFWRCPPPELRVPIAAVRQLRSVGGVMVAVGPHGSTTPQATLNKLGVDAVVLGECEEILPLLAGDWRTVNSLCYRSPDGIIVRGGPHAGNVAALPPLEWPPATLRRHHHHHHRFDAAPALPGAEVETSRGCPYHCTFCAKDNFRNRYRRRPVPVVLEEIDALLVRGVEYVYFIDEIFLPNRELLEALASRRLKFGIQTRIDLWSLEMLDLLGCAGCVSIEAGVESITEEGRARLDKNCRHTTYELADLLIHAKQCVPFVQANLIEMREDDRNSVEAFRQYLQRFGVWANKPVPLFPYPGSPEYSRRWGAPDDNAWERAHDSYINGYQEFSDIQEEHPVPLIQLELSGTR